MQEDEGGNEERNVGLDQAEEADQCPGSRSDDVSCRQRWQVEACSDDQEDRGTGGEGPVEQVPGLDPLENPFLSGQPWRSFVIILVVVNFPDVKKEEPAKEDVEQELESGRHDEPAAVAHVEYVEQANLSIPLFDLANFFRSKESHLDRWSVQQEVHFPGIEKRVRLLI